MSNILVIGEVAGGALSRSSLEALTVARQLAASLDFKIHGLLIGHDMVSALETFNGDFETLYVAEGSQYTPYTGAAFAGAAEAAVADCQASIVLFMHSAKTRDWAPQLAARLGAGLVMDCISVSAAADGAILATKPVYGGGVLGQFVIRGTPRMASIRPGVFAPQTGGRPGHIVRLDAATAQQRGVKVLEEVKSVGVGPKLKDAKIIVSGGRGVGGVENWHLINRAADVLGAAVGCSRPIADAGWIPSSQQVGLSGSCVSPDLYIAVGISGAVQHLAGISAAKTVIAVNSDPEAEIFSRADYGIVADCTEALPAFVEKVEQLRSKHAT